MYGSAYVFGKREHMQISFIRDMAPENIKRIIDVIQEIIISIFVLGVMIYGGYFSSLKQMTQVDAVLQIPIGIIYSAIPISGVFIVFYVIYNIKKIIFNKEEE